MGGMWGFSKLEDGPFGIQLFIKVLTLPCMVDGSSMQMFLPWPFRTWEVCAIRFDELRGGPLWDLALRLIAHGSLHSGLFINVGFSNDLFVHRKHCYLLRQIRRLSPLGSNFSSNCPHFPAWWMVHPYRGFFHRFCTWVACAICFNELGCGPFWI